MTESIEQLTPREREILALIAEGKENKEIAADLDLRLSTIKGYVENILRTLGVPNRSAAVAAWFRYESRGNPPKRRGAFGGGRKAE